MASTTKKKKAPMTKAELISKIANTKQLTKVEVTNAFKIVIEGVKEVLSEKDVDHVKLQEFVDLEIVERAARDGRNPQTGEKMKIPATKTIKATASKSWVKVIKDGK